MARLIWIAVVLSAVFLLACEGETKPAEMTSSTPDIGSPTATVQPTPSGGPSPTAAVDVTPSAALSPTPGATASQGPSIDPKVLEALSEPSEVPVIVSVRRPPELVGGEPDVDMLASEGERLVDQVLATLEPDEFQLTYRWNTLFAFAGRLTASGLDKLATDPQVEAVVLDEAAPLTD